MRVSKRFPLAVHSLLFVAVLSPKKRVTSALVAESTGANAVTVRNIFLDLSDSGLLIASAGKNGGVHLARDPKDINLWDIYQAVETNDVEEMFKIYEGSDTCPVGKNFYQVLYPHMASAVDAMKESMEQVTLETLLDELKALLKERTSPMANHYNFYGWEKATVPAITTQYAGILTPRDLYDALSELWCADTCAPRLRSGWTQENKTLGQCSITAFLAQDIFGGEVYGILRPGGNYHCYNKIGDCTFDLTSEQFGGEVLDYTDNPPQSRTVHFAKEEKRLRYEKLKADLQKFCDKKQTKNKQQKIDT